MKNISQIIATQKVIPVVVIDKPQQARGLSQALLDGGVSIIEITLRNAYGLDAIKLVKDEFPAMTVLAGTVNNAEQMHAVINAQVDGVVSPGINETLIDIAKQHNMAYLPGVANPADIMTAIEHGLSECKLFPADIVGGIAALKAYAAPFNTIRFCPTGGINFNNYQDFLALDNVMCVGGSWLAPKELVKKADWAAITDLCKAL